MFRIISNSGILVAKSKVGSQVGTQLNSQVGATTRHNLNLGSRRLNSTLSNQLEQDILKPAAPLNRSGYRPPSRKNFRNVNLGRSLYVSHDITRDNPWYHELLAFEDCVSVTYDPKNTFAYRRPEFWDLIHKAMELYTKLSGTPDFTAERVAKLIYLLHTGLRQNRQQTLKLDKKPDFDARNFHREMMEYICALLRTIAADIVAGVNSVNQYGAMHLVTSFKELQLSAEAISIWERGRASQCGDVFLDPRVVGVMLPLMLENGRQFSEIQKLFEQLRSQISYYHPNLAVGMIRACLLADEIDVALRLFEELCSNSQHTKFGYLTETHLSFIGESRDLKVANTFFENALYNQMPYKVELQVPYVKKFIQNTWAQTGDFDAVTNIWVKCWYNYGNSVTKGVSLLLNELFLLIFFQRYKDDKMAGFIKLRELILVYAGIKPLDEPFLNILMTKCVVWQDAGVIREIFNCYDYYGVQRTQVAYRVGLKALGLIDVSEQEIMARWLELVTFSDVNGATFIHNADWAALRDATIASAFGNRVMLYARLVKAFGPFLKDKGQMTVLVDVNSLRYQYIAPTMANLAAVPVDDVMVPQFTNIRRLA